MAVPNAVFSQWGQPVYMEKLLLLIDADTHAVYFNGIVCANENVFHAVDDLRANEISAVGVYLDGNVRHFDLEIFIDEI